MVTIYALTEDLEGTQIRYIGKTVRTIKKRFYEHVTRYNRNISRNCSWLKNKIEVKKELPGIILIDQVLDSESDFWEYHYISLYRSWGFTLNNHALEALGEKYASGEIKRKISNTMKNKIRDPRSYDHLRTPEAKQRVKETQKERIEKLKVPIKLIKNTEILEFQSVADAGRYFNTNPEHIRRVLNNRQRTSGFKTFKGYLVEKMT